MASPCPPKSSAWDKQKTAMLSNWESMRQNGLLTDLTIECRQEKFKVHRTYVCASVPFFNNMYQTCQDSLKDTVELNSIPPHVMSIILDFIYTGVVFPIKDDLKLLEDLLHASHMLLIDHLFDEYSDTLVKLICPDNFAKLLTIAELYGACDNFATIITILASEFDVISKSANFLALDVKHLNELLCHSHLNNTPADGVVQAILPWVEFNKEERLNHLESLISLVGIDRLSDEYVKILLTENIIQSIPSLHEKILAATNTTITQTLICYGRIGDGAVSTTAKYCLDTLTWSPVTNLDFELEFGMAVAKYLDCFYFIGGGGWEEEYSPSTSIIKYDPNLFRSEKQNDLLIPVNQAGVGVLESYIYVVGGRSENKILTEAVQRVDPNNGNTVLLTPTIQLHNSPSVIPYHGCLYVVGSGTESFSCVERYDPAVDKWSEATVVPEGVVWSQTVLVKDKLVVLCRGCDTKLHLYDLESDHWETINFFGGPTRAIWGIWAPHWKSDLPPILLIRDESGKLHWFNIKTSEWLNTLSATVYPMHWPLCVLESTRHVGHTVD